VVDKAMVESCEETIFNAICRDIRENGRLTDEQKARLAETFGSRFAAAYRAVEEGKVKKYVFQPSGRTMWIVTGKERNYQILPSANFCSCFDFYFRVIGHDTSFCYHLIAQKLAKVLGKYSIVEELDVNFIHLARELRRIPDRRRLLPIAEVENIRRVAKGILLEEKELLIEGLLEEVKEAGFVSLTTRHLASILIADKAKRFKHANELWMLSN